MKVKVRELYMRDKVVKKLFTSFSGYQYLARIVCEVLDLPSELFSFQIFHPSVGVNENVVNSEVDLIIEDNASIVNIEINTSNSRSIQNKNTAYFCHLILKQIKTSKDYDKVLKKVYQINLNSYDVSHEERFVTRSRLIDVETKEEVHPILEIVDVYLAKIIKTDYTIVKERKNSLEYLLYLLVCNDEKILREVYEGDNLMEKMVDEAKELTDNFDSLLYYDYDELKKQEAYELGEASGVEQGVELGIEQGIEQNKVEIALNMLKKNMDTKLICEVTGLTHDELNVIKKGIE